MNALYTQFGNSERTLYSVVSSSPELLDACETESKLLGSLPQIIDHFQEASYPEKADRMAFYPSSAAEAIQCISKKVRVVYNNKEYDARRASYLNIELMELALTEDADEAESIAKKAIMRSLDNFPMTSIEDAVKLVTSATTLVDESDALSFAVWFMSKKEKRILNTKKINNLRSLSILPQLEMTVDLMNSHCGVIVDNGPTGVGKSLRIVTLAKKAMKEKKKVAIICHRVSISYAAHQQIPGSFHYQNTENPLDLDTAQCLIIVVNSIHYSNFFKFLSECDVVIIEEAKQLLDHVSLCKSNEEFNPIDRKKIFSNLHSVIQSAKTVVLTDADCNDSTINFVKNVRKDITLLQSSVDFSDVKIEMTEHDEVFSKINAAAKDGKKFIVSCDVLKTANGLEHELVNLFGLNVLKITSKNSKDSAQKAFMIDPNTECEKYDAIIYSPVITSTLSITNPRFPLHFGLFAGVIESSGAIQQLRRNRPCKEFIVGIKKNNEVKSEEVSLPATASYYEKFVAETEVASNYDKNHIGAAFFYTAKHLGFDVSASTNKDEKTFGQAIFKQVRKLETDVFLETMMTIKSTVAAKKVSGVKITHQEESDFAELLLIEKTLGKPELTVEDIESWKRGGLGIHVKNVKIMLKSKAECQIKDSREQSKMARDRQNLTAKHAFFNEIFSTLGINTEDFSGSFTVEQCNELMTSLRSNTKEFKKTGLYTVRALKVGEVLKSQTKAVKAMLKEFGLEIVEAGKEKQTMTYKISAESKNLILACVTRPKTFVSK
jgi:hypothetical protein